MLCRPLEQRWDSGTWCCHWCSLAQCFDVPEAQQPFILSQQLKELPSRWKWAGRDLRVHYNHKPCIFYCITVRSYTALMNFSVENCDCKHNCTALGRLWQLCWWDILTSSTHWDLSGQPMTADNRTSSPAEEEEISWTVYLGSTWCRRKDNAELNNNLARSSQSQTYLFIFN